MRTIACKTVWALLVGVSLVLSLNSCSKDPVIPEDETKNKLHEDPAKMTVRLVECHLHADWNEIQKAGGPHQNPESPARYMKRVQEITYELKAGSGWTLAEGSQGKFYVQKNGEYKNGNNFTPAPVYLMFIYYYNSKGELMNGQFVENGQENIHQHFFTPENVRPTFDGKPEADDNDPEALVDYLYVDTTPWDKTKHDNEAEITGGTNPVGLKGVIRFLKDRKEFDLKLRLYHGYNSKKNPQTNGFDPFYKPSGVLIQRGTWDINLSIPVVVFWSREEFVDVDPEADVNLIGEDSLDEDQFQGSGQYTLRHQAFLYRLLHLFPHLFQISEYLTSLVFFYIIYKSTSFVQTPFHHLGHTCLRVEISVVESTQLVPQCASTHTIYLPTINRIPLYKSLEQHPIGMAGQTDIRFPNDLYSIGTVYNLQNSTVCTMAFPRQRQTSVKCDPELFCSGVLFQK